MQKVELFLGICRNVFRRIRSERCWSFFCYFEVAFTPALRRMVKPNLGVLNPLVKSLFSHRHCLGWARQTLRMSAVHSHWCEHSDWIRTKTAAHRTSWKDGFSSASSKLWCSLFVVWKRPRPRYASYSNNYTASVAYLVVSASDEEIPVHVDLRIWHLKCINAFFLAL